jgi:hypothetical protein
MSDLHGHFRHCLTAMILGQEISPNDEFWHRLTA